MMKHAMLTLLFVAALDVATAAGAQNNDSNKQNTPPTGQDNTARGQNKPTKNAASAKNAGKRHTPPWTNDSANINLHQSRTPPKSDLPRHHKGDLPVKSEWKQRFKTSDTLTANNGKEVYGRVCQACHMANGQGAHGAGDFPSFVGDKRLRTPDYPIDIALFGLRGMPAFGDKLSNQQIADVVNYLRTNFGNQLKASTTPEDVARVRHKGTTAPEDVGPVNHSR